MYGSGSLSVYQWRDVSRVDTNHTGQGAQIHDWFETRIKDIFTNATGDAATVLATVDDYDDDETTYKGRIVDWDHSATSDMSLWAYSRYVRLNIVDANPDAWTCGEALGPDHSGTFLHEARHCYQDYLSGRNDIGTDDLLQPGTPKNDDDQDWLVDVIPVDPDTFIADTTSEREICVPDYAGPPDPDTTKDSFQGDDQSDAQSSPAGSQAYERDAEAFAAAYYDSLPP